MGFALSDLKLTSTAFAQGELIPALHTGEGEDVSPELSWTNVPDGTASFAVICHDPDAPLITSQGTYGYVHWVLYNIPASTHGLVQGTSEHTGGTNDFGKQNYGGPMPPNGHGKHQYYYWIIALDKDLELEAGLSQIQLLERIEPNAIGMNRLVGVYERA
jgi:hypothetical protein